MRADHFASLVEDGTGRLQISDIEQGPFYRPIWSMQG